MSKFLKIWVLVLCLFHRTVAAETLEPDLSGLSSIEESLLLPYASNPFPYTSNAGIRRTLDQPPATTFSLGLGPKIIELKTSYMEKREEISALASSLSAPKVGHFFGLFATSSPFDGKLVGEGELAYSTFGFTTTSEQRPTMSRLGLKGHWGSMSYGADYRSFGSGFVSQTGVKIDHDRDESQFWGEYNFQILRLRGAISELWEKNSASNQLSLTRTAITSLNVSKPSWNALLSSSYSILGQGEGLNQKTVAVTNGLLVSYRPVTVLTIEPNLSFKEEWDQGIGLRTETPSAGLTLVSSPMRDVQLTGRASYARSISEDRFKEASTINTEASLNWKIGRSLLGEQFLSFQVEYRNQFFLNSPSNSQEYLTGMVRLKIIGF